MLAEVRDEEIRRVRAAVVRYQAAQDAIQDRIEEEGGPTSAHEHDSGWNRLADRQERAGAWLCILLEKRGRPEDVALVSAIRSSAWP